VNDIVKRRGKQNKTKPSQFVIDEEKKFVTQSVREIRL
jgi:hypothetical protein